MNETAPLSTYEAAIIVPVAEAEAWVGEFRLRNAVYSLFPDSPPYEGQFGEHVPHLTVARVEEASLAPIEADFSKYAKKFLPLHCRARKLWLMDNLETQ